MRIDNMNLNVTRMQDSGRKEAPEAAVQEADAIKVNNETRQDINMRSIINDEMLENSIKQANNNLNQYNKVIERTVHEKTHTIMYILKDTLTDEVIKEFPPRKIQDMIAKMWEMAGILVDERR